MMAPEESMERIFTPSRTRKHIRARVTTACQVVAEDGFRLLGEQTVDVSASGLLLASSRPATLGERVLVSLRLPQAQSWIDAEGQVQRALWHTGSHDGKTTSRWALAIAFDGMSLVDRALLEAALSRVAEKMPTVVAIAPPMRRDYAATLLRWAA